MAESINAAIIERLEKVVYTLQAKVEEIQKTLDRETNLIKAGCERDIRKVDDRLRAMEKKMWSIFGALSIISFIVSPIGQKIVRPVFQPSQVELTR